VAVDRCGAVGENRLLSHRIPRSSVCCRGRGWGSDGEPDPQPSLFLILLVGDAMTEPNTMTPQQRTRMRELPILIEQERDEKTMDQLTDELIQLTKLWLTELRVHDMT
jgi:hypothetical protein